MTDHISKLSKILHLIPKAKKQNSKLNLVSKHNFQHYSTKDHFTPKKIIQIFKTNFAKIEKLKSKA